jgi:flagellar basal-body rod protein FlgC
METSGSAMQAERARAELVAANMANAETTRTETGGPYRRQHVVFAANGGRAEFLNALTDATGSHAGNGIPQLAINITTTEWPALGVHIAQVIEDSSTPLKRYDPGHPDAGPDGYVAYPDINPLTEMVDLMGATRAYGLNSSAVQGEKGMISSALEIARS